MSFEGADGTFGYVAPMEPFLMRVFLRGIMALAQMKRPESLASAAEDMTFLMIWVIFSTGPLRRPAHLNESVPEGYHGLGADEEA